MTNKQIHKLLNECISLMIEMPHVEVEDANITLHSGTQVVIIDFRIEHLPISAKEKRNLLMAFTTSGFIADIGDESFVFKQPQGNESPVRKTTHADSSLPHLPDVWFDNAVFVEE